MEEAREREKQVDEARTQSISDLLNEVFLPLLLILGLMGNLLSILVFSRESMRKNTTFRYLLLLSVIDMCTLLTGCGDKLLMVYTGVNVRLLSEFVCKAHSFLVYFFTQSSSLLLACMSVDRALVITVKMSKKLSTVSMANKVFFGILGLVTLINLHFLVFAHIVAFEQPVAPNLLSGDNNTLYLFNQTAEDADSTNTTNDTFILQKYCYATYNTTYFMYLQSYSPW
jgi:hypothetical protein